MRYLRDEINRHDHLYYILAAPELSDRDYDNLYHELQTLEEEFPTLRTPDSPTLRVGGQPLEGFENVEHRVPMMSLGNTYDTEELLQFDKRTRAAAGETELTYVVEPKVDGVAIALRYENGMLTVGSTRGDGRTGDDVTANLRTIRSIPLRLQADPPPALLEVRGEVFMAKDDFAALNNERQESGQEPFANPRNATAGSLKLLNPALVSQRPLDAVFYDVLEHDGIEFTTQTALLEGLDALGLRTVPSHWACETIEDVLTRLNELDDMRHSFPFEVDGGVILVNQRALHSSLGATAKSPRWATAYKYEPERAETTVLAITIQVGRTGVLTPVAELEPVSLAGTTVKRATLHNADEIKRKDIRIGDHVIVEKAGEIIPAVVEVVIAKRTETQISFEMPNTCPVCGSAAIQKDGEVALRCENLQCPAQIKSWIRHFAARNAMDIDGLGDAIIEQLVDAGRVSSPADLYRLVSTDVASLERMAEKSADNLITGIQASTKRDFWRVLFALGIRHIGARSAQILADNVRSMESLSIATPESLEEIEDIGPVLAASILDFFSTDSNRELIAALTKAGLSMAADPETLNSDGPFTGKTFVLTGSLNTMTRDDAGELIRKHGGTVSSSVSGNTSFVVAGDKAGSKLSKAEQLDVPILTEQEFIDLLE